MLSLDHPTRTLLSPAGAQTLFRGLATIETIATGSRRLQSIAAAIGCTRSTTHRILRALVCRDYVRHSANSGYVLGPKLIELGFSARTQMPVTAIAHAHLEALASETSDTVHLGIRDGSHVLYVDRIPGTRGLQISSYVGYRNPLACTGIGRALMLDMDEDQWRELYRSAQDAFRRSGRTPPKRPLWPQYLKRMRAYAARGYAFDLQENEGGIRCVAAPIRDVSGAIVASISVASAIQYMPEGRMRSLRLVVIARAADISRELGWSELKNVE
jgi:DNA-binding IclR family transcriptional regulator